ncbi:MAG: 1-deoxy-D-xylulose-5-phosphate reductoisomerase [Candidatus Omnitrophica bacterium CG11_big_fil_rev_8_21_14_0_20_64_10]|nr:MAG: 1-deoxy-D-xylulose-5-phosphate reductoisomerase [Candidatus Omnitrophica bacterium CG11_big_fil_rev_8_21_14_0_20_64_10]
MKRKKIVLLGSTGSIGVSALQVVAEHPEAFEVIGLAAGRSGERLVEQARQFRVRRVAAADPAAAAALRGALPGGVEGSAGPEAVEALAGWPEADIVVVAITGAAALGPALAAIRAGRRVGLANKETLVMAGGLMMRAARESGAELIPIDSEHSAIFQSLQGNPRGRVRRIWLTSSGGPLREVPAERFSALTKAEVMNHPRWKMGPKITVDSATMMNKALEVIEARWLFDLPVEKIQVLVHPEAVVHSMVEYLDGSVIAQLGVTDMRIPIQYALTYPDRLALNLPPLDLVEWGRLHFEAPNPEKFPALRLGAEAARIGGTLPAVFNAANEAVVEAFLNDGIPFTAILPLVSGVVESHRPAADPTLAQILEADRWAREQAQIRLTEGAKAK